MVLLVRILYILRNKNSNKLNRWSFYYYNILYMYIILKLLYFNTFYKITLDNQEASLLIIHI
jgi:hypothetical protein